MLVKVIGRKNLNFTDDSGKEVSGVQLWVAFDKSQVDGQETKKIFCNRANGVIVPDDVRPGVMVNMAFDMDGKPESVSIADSVTNGSTLKINKQQ